MHGDLAHRIAAADHRRCSSELAKYKASCFRLVPRATRALLDLGSATGEDVLSLAEYLGPGARVSGLERDAELVNEARRRARNVPLDIGFVVGDCLAPPFAAATFDFVRADAVLRELPRLQEALAQCWRVLRPGGLLVVHDDVDIEGISTRAGFRTQAKFDIFYGRSAVPTWILSKAERDQHARI